MKTVVALYDKLSDARSAVERLVDLGIDRDQINLVASDPDKRHATQLERVEHEDHVDAGEGAAAGAVSGAVVGGLTGLLLGLGALVIPGLGPIIAAGPVAAALAGAGVGLVAGGLVGALVGWGLPEDEAHIYAEAVRRGGTLVLARVPDGRVDDVTSALDDYNPVDVERRAAHWREEGWSGFDHEAKPYTSKDIEADRSRYKTTETTGGTARVGVHPYQESQTNGRNRSSTGDFSAYRSDFRNHYSSYYANTDYDYDHYEPGYRFGYTMATDSRYRDRDWDDVIADLRREWDAKFHAEGPWEDFKDSVRYAWDQITGEHANYYDYHSDFRNHYTANYANRGRDFTYYEPGYRFGYTAAYDSRYQNRDWRDIEPDLRRRWEESYHDRGAWDEFKDSVRHAWNKITNGRQEHTRRPVK